MFANRRILLQLVIGGSATVAWKDGLIIPGGGFEIGSSNIFALSAPFPGPSGGHVFGISAEPLVGIYGAGFVATERDLGSGGVMARFGLGAAFQYLRFGAVETDGKQATFGVAAGYRPGFQYTAYEGGFAEQSSDFTHGPFALLSFGALRAKSGHLGRGLVMVSLTHLPQPDLLFVNVGGGAAFN